MFVEKPISQKCQVAKVELRCSCWMFRGKGGSTKDNLSAKGWISFSVITK